SLFPCIQEHEPVTPAVIYCRYSPRRRNCDSNRKQFQRCRKYCASLDYEVVAVRWDTQVSGDDDSRPGLARAVEDACAHKAVLVVYSLDRFARHPGHAWEVLERLRKTKADMASMTESFNTRSAIGEMLFGILACFARLQLRQISERTSAAMQQHQANGR